MNRPRLNASKRSIGRLNTVRGRASAWGSAGFSLPQLMWRDEVATIGHHDTGNYNKVARTEQSGHASESKAAVRLTFAPLWDQEEGGCGRARVECRVAR